MIMALAKKSANGEISSDSIEKLIDQVSRLSVNDDPLVVESRAKLKEFQTKKDTLATGYREHGAKKRTAGGGQCQRDARWHRSKPQAIDGSCKPQE